MAATECTGSTSGNEAAPPPPPPPIETSVDLWDPFGQPGELRAAADAWDAVAAHLDDMRSHLDGVVRSSAAGWSGEARRAFSAHWEQMAGELGNGSGGMREVAEQLRAMADELEAKNNLIQEIYVTIAATAAVSIATGFISFGAGFVAGAASVAANVARAERLLAAVKAFLVASRGVMAAVKATKVGAFAVRFGGFAAQGVVETAVVKKVALDQNPFDPDSWTPGDALLIAGGGLLSTKLAGPLTRSAAPPPAPKLPSALKGGPADVDVYYGTVGGKPVYAGITNNIDRRAAQHGDRFQLDPVTTSGVTRGEARAIEQALIKRNPGFLNKINSISPKHPYYDEAVGWGEDWLRRNGL